MAAIAPSAVLRRVNFSFGHLKGEAGRFTSPGTSDLSLRTRLAHLVWFKAVPEAGENTNQECFLNSKDNSGVEDDPGWAHIESNIAAENYNYFALGEG